MPTITSSRRENYDFVVPGSERDDRIFFNGGDRGQDEPRWVVIVGGAGDDEMTASPTFERGLRYSMYGDFNFGEDQDGVFNGPWARGRGHSDHVTQAGNDTLHFGQGAHHVKGGLSDPSNGRYEQGDLYVGHGQITVTRGPLPELRWFDPEIGENDKLLIVRDDTDRGGPMGYTVSKVKFDRLDDDTIRFRECIVTGYTENELIDRQAVRLGFLDRPGQGGDHDVILELDGRTPYETARDFLHDNTRGGEPGTWADGYGDFIL